VPIRSVLDNFLQTDPRDVGCDQAMEVLHIYAERTSRGEATSPYYQGVIAHLRSCPPCSDDFRGLMAALDPEWENS
jgi:hypothetical protein